MVEKEAVIHVINVKTRTLVGDLSPKPKYLPRQGEYLHFPEDRSGNGVYKVFRIFHVIRTGYPVEINIFVIPDKGDETVN